MQIPRRNVSTVAVHVVSVATARKADDPSLRKDAKGIMDIPQSKCGHVCEICTWQIDFIRFRSHPDMLLRRDDLGKIDVKTFVGDLSG